MIFNAESARREQAVFRGVVFLVFSCFLPVGACIEVSSVGPYTTWFNQRKMARAKAAGLVGQPEANVEAVLGRPNNDYTHAAYILSPDGGTRVVGDPLRTFDYYPYPFVPFSKFQVHCHGGVVTGLEMFDD